MVYQVKVKMMNDMKQNHVISDKMLVMTAGTTAEVLLSCSTKGGICNTNVTNI